MYTLDEIRPVWAEINLDNLAFNIGEVRKLTKKDALVMAVLKANGYGHGAVDIARTFLENGADRLAVAILTEAIELRKYNISEPILILGFTPPNQYKKVVEYNLTQTIYNYDDAKVLSDIAVGLGKSVNIHIKLDSGMGRIGFITNYESINEIIKISKLPNIYIEGIFTHFAMADELDKSFTIWQYNKFIKAIEELESMGLSIPLKHASNSAGIIDLPEFSLNMVRPGIMIYGYYPSEKVKKKNIVLKPAMTLKTKITQIKIVPKGTGISYGQIFVTEQQSKIATIPIGYADGFTRLFTQKVEVLVNGKRAKVVGKICMDQCMIDVTHINDAKLGDDVIIFGSGYNSPSADELAEKIGTINYEILSMVSRRVPRVYVKDNNIVKIRDYLFD